jgi:hypothetical protein
MKVSAVTAVILVTVLGTLVSATSATAGPASATRHVLKVGSAQYKPTPVGSGAPAPLSTEIRRSPEGAQAASAATSRPLGPNRSFGRQAGAAAATSARTAAAEAATSPGLANSITPDAPKVLASFDGLNHRAQRTANGGNQFSVEPPDQALCVGDGHVVEAVNDVFRVRDTDGSNETGVVDLNTFFGYPAQIDRTTGVVGPFVTDPTCLYDPTTKTFFFVVLTLQTTATGAFTGKNTLDIAVAKDPTASWNIYQIDVTDDGTNGTPAHPHCPCIGDYPHVGVDAHGFYVTTNEYSFFGPEFNSAQIYAFSKRALARGDADVLVTQFDTTAADRGLNGFTIWPAQSPAADQYSTAAGGTAYFLSSNAAEEATGTTAYVSNSIVTWSLTNTNSLDSARPNPRLNDTRVAVRTYSLPPAANQKQGPFPLGQCLNDGACATGLLGKPDRYAPEVEAALDSGDTRMQQVTYANGTLYGALDTAVKVGGATKAGIGWYIVRPESEARQVSASLTAEGQLGLAGNNLTYPAIGVTAEGKGALAFTLLGDGHYPSSAYAAFDGRNGAGNIFLAKAGLGPEDGFSGYRAFGDPPRQRWGDYGATAVDGDTIWIASEYIGQRCTLAQYTTAPFGSCAGTRTALANWDTRISQIQP